MSAFRRQAGLPPMDDRDRHISAPLLERARMKLEGNDPILNGNRQHLTGEMIRQIRQQQKFVHKDTPVAALLQQRVMQAAQQTATIAALQQHNLQMQAAYEKALKDKTYLRQQQQSQQQHQQKTYNHSEERSNHPPANQFKPPPQAGAAHPPYCQLGTQEITPNSRKLVLLEKTLPASISAGRHDAVCPKS